jgi:hypothetical protein
LDILQKENIGLLLWTNVFVSRWKKYR